MASSGATVRVRGLREVQQAFAKCEGDLKPQMLAAGKAAAEPVAASARGKLSRFQGISLGTIGPRATVSGAFVTQRAKKITGLRGDFGVLQMRGLLDALQENSETVLAIYERAIDRLVDDAGF